MLFFSVQSYATKTYRGKTFLRRAGNPPAGPRLAGAGDMGPPSADTTGPRGTAPFGFRVYTPGFRCGTSDPDGAPGPRRSPRTSTMQASAASPVSAPISRRLGHHQGDLPGPTLLVVGGIHGNEPSGLMATERVLRWLGRTRPAFRGRLVGVAGNLAALARGERFVEEDLNRIWSTDRIEALRVDPASAGSVEAREQAALLAELDEIFASAQGPVIFLDLHTSSARGEPFVCIGDTLRNRELAMRFPVPVILGLEENIDGALLEYVNNLGHVTVGVEAGQHDHPESIDRHEAFVLLALIAAGCIAERDVPRAPALRHMLREAVGALPPVLEVRHRHAISTEHRFAMRPGYANFQPILAGEVLATDVTGEIRSPENGRILLPLYQGLGNDGFFVVRRVRPVWLAVSAALRRLGADRLVTWMPGVRRAEGDSRELLVDPRVARWFTVEIFHLLGYRKERPTDGLLRFSRRVEGL